MEKKEGNRNHKITPSKQIGGQARFAQDKKKSRENRRKSLTTENTEKEKKRELLGKKQRKIKTGKEDTEKKIR